MTRTKEQDTQYQKDRRERLAAQQVEEVIDEVFAGPKAYAFVAEKGKVVVVREYRGVSGYHYLPGDHAIGNMAQKQRDLIISKLPKTPRAR